MEVHHKHHTPKNWKEYFTEFIMLFAAVTLGFFAENIREHYIESHRATVFLEQIKNDLKKDIANMNSNVKVRQSKAVFIDSLLSLPPELTEKKDENTFGYCTRMISLRGMFSRSETGFEQLKNAGGLRLIKNPTLVQKLQEYEHLFDRLLNLQDLEEVELQDYRVRITEIVDYRIYRDIKRKNENTIPGENVIIEYDMTPEYRPLLTKDFKKINSVLAMVVFVKNMNNSAIKQQTTYIKAAEELIELIDAENNH